MGENGGARPGAGRKKGGKNQSTLSKEEGKAVLRALVMESMRPMVEAQVANAQGLKYLVTRDKKSGKFVKVSEAMARAMTDAGESDQIEIWEKEPSVPAFTDLVNRALGKPVEEVEMRVSVEQEVLARLEAGRKHAKR